MFKMVGIALCLLMLTGCGTITTQFLRSDCRPEAGLMAANDLPEPPPASTDVVAWKYYIRYLFVEIELRDVKQERLTHHVREHCQ